MAAKTPAELLKDLKETALVPGDVRSTVALMYAYLRTEDGGMDEALAQAFGNARDAMMLRESLRDVRARTVQ
jgi:hypothetical protein